MAVCGGQPCQITALLQTLTAHVCAFAGPRGKSQGSEAFVVNRLAPASFGQANLSASRRVESTSNLQGEPPAVAAQLVKAPCQGSWAMFGGMVNGGGTDAIGGNLGNGMPAGENGFQGNNMMAGAAAPRDVPAGPRPGGGGGRNRMDSEFVEGKLFLGGLDNATTKETLLEYVSQWCA